MALVFTLEAIFAEKGDTLLLHYGPWDRPSWILIDGGPQGVYRKYLRPRLLQLREQFEYQDDESLPLRMVMVSHVDDDHVAGVLDLFEETLEAKEQQRPLPYAIGTLWHNSFDDLLGNADQEVVSRMAATVASNDPLGLAVPEMSPESQAVVASTKQGRELRNAATKLGVSINEPFEGLIMAPAEREVVLGHGLSFTVIGPSRARVLQYQTQWDKDLKQILEREQHSARATAFEDQSPFNLASVCVLARMEGKTMLLTGDARGDYVMEGLESAGVLTATEPLHVDILKVPHHGSDRNLDDVFFERITADHYVISANGADDNPETSTLDMIARARGTSVYAVHFTFADDSYARESSQRRRTALRRVHDWVERRPAGCQVTYQGGRRQGPHSVFLDLLEPLYREA